MRNYWTHADDKWKIINFRLLFKTSFQKNKKGLKEHRKFQILNSNRLVYKSTVSVFYHPPLPPKKTNIRFNEKGRKKTKRTNQRRKQEKSPWGFLFEFFFPRPTSSRKGFCKANASSQSCTFLQLFRKSMFSIDNWLGCQTMTFYDNARYLYVHALPFMNLVFWLKNIVYISKLYDSI